jgi:hypothetical protein
MIKSRIFLLITLLFLGGCSSEPKQKGVRDPIAIAFPVNQKIPWQLDPSKATREVDLKAINYTQRGLFTLDKFLSPHPDLVQSPKFSNQGKTLHLTMLPNIRWSDNTALTAQHAKNGLLRSLRDASTLPTSAAFLDLLPTECKKELEKCIRTQDQTLILDFDISAELAIPYFTQPFSFPQRSDVLSRHLEKPFLNPTAYPTLGPYKIINHQKDMLTLSPQSSKHFPIQLLQVESVHQKTPTNFNDLMTKGLVHVLESPPLSFLETSPWAKHIQAHPDFNLLILQDPTQKQTYALTHLAMPKKIQAYIRNKGLPLSTPPMLIASLIDSCATETPQVILHLTDGIPPTEFQLFGPRHIMTFLTAEALKKEVLKTYRVPLVFTPLSSNVGLPPPPESSKLSIFRSRVPSALTLYKTFFDQHSRSSNPDGHSFYRFLYNNYKNSSGEKRQKVQKDMLTYLCKDKKRMVPLLSIPAYTVVSPRILGYKREGTGVTYIWDLK